NSPKRCATFSIRRVTADASAEFDHYRRSAGNYVSRTFRIPDRGTEVRALGHSHRRRVRIRYRGNQSYIECFSFFQYAPRGLSADLVILTKPFAQLRRVSRIKPIHQIAPSRALRTLSKQNDPASGHTRL